MRRGNKVKLGSVRKECKAWMRAQLRDPNGPYIDLLTGEIILGMLAEDCLIEFNLNNALEDDILDWAYEVSEEI